MGFKHVMDAIERKTAMPEILIDDMSVVSFKSGAQCPFLWGDTPTLTHFLVLNDHGDTVDLYVAPYTFKDIPKNDLVHVAEEYEPITDDEDDMTWLEMLG